VGKALAVAVGGCQQGPSTLGAEGRQGRCAGGRREEANHMGARGEEAAEGPRDQGPAEAEYWNWPVGSKGGQDSAVGRKKGPVQGTWPGYHTRVGVQGGLPGFIWSGNYMRDFVVVVGWEGADCGAGPGMGGQCQLVLNPGGGLQVVERELGEDGARES